MSSVSHGLSFLYVDGMLEGLRCSWAGEREWKTVAEQLFLPTGRLPDWVCMLPDKQGMNTRYCPSPPPSFLLFWVLNTTTTEYMCCFTVETAWHLSVLELHLIFCGLWPKSMFTKRTEKGHHQYMAAAMQETDSMTWLFEQLSAQLWLLRLQIIPPGR